MNPKNSYISFCPLVFRTLLFLVLICGGSLALNAQTGRFWMPSDTLHKGRFWSLAGGGAAAYTGTSIGLYHIWYKNYETGPLHSKDDWGQWENMDKWGHLMATYTESYLAYKGARWTGLEENTSIWVGAGVGTLLQLTIEVMDGFSERWGFSWYDLAFNTAGATLFAGQQFLWEEQRVLIKVSTTRPNYSTQLREGTNGLMASPRDAAYDLYGRSIFEYLLKDYNAMTVWASINPNSFLGKHKANSPIPDWLNLAVGIGADGIYGAWGNVWTAPGGERLQLTDYERYQQYYLSLDIDTARIRTRSPFLKTLFSTFRWIKVPAPTLEWNTRGEVIFHPVFW